MHRYGKKLHSMTGNVKEENFMAEFEQNYSIPLLESHLQIIQARKTKFVGNKTLCGSLKYLQVAMKGKQTRKYVTAHISSILEEISLPILMVTESEFELWNENPIEYIRLQVDNSNCHNPKPILKCLLGIICNVKKSRKDRTSPYLNNYIQTLINYLNSPTMTAEAKDAILHALGSLKDHIENCPSYRSQMEPILMNYVFPELSSQNPFLRARACWLYGQFGDFDFANQDHIRSVVNIMF